MNKEKAIIVFVKYPERGRVKTRLAIGTGDEFAVKFYKLIAKNIFNEISTLFNVDVYVFYPEFDNESDIKNWIGKDFNYAKQKGNNLGEKMNNAFNYIFKKKYSKAIILGTDIPEINSEIIQITFSHLSDFKIVISPSSDGGYSLLGQQKNYSFLFENIEWSTSSVFLTTLLKIRQNNISFKKLNELNDIDTKNDLLLWMNSTNNKTLKFQVKELAEKEGIKL